MANQGNRNQEDDWARQVPDWRNRGPYEDYGWERGQSGLPYFRDPSTHLEPQEMQRVRRWYQRHPGAPRDRDLGNMPGPYTGMGPRGYRRSDQRIMEDICDRMTQHGQLDASQVSVDVNDGEVTLSGTVPDRRSKRMAEDIADSVSGVQDVHNQIRTSGMPGGGRGRMDRVGHTGVYPASSQEAPEDAQVRSMAEWGQGERGAAGYEDHGSSELNLGQNQEQKGE